MVVEKTEVQTMNRIKEKRFLVTKMNKINLAEKVTKHAKNLEENTKNASMNTMKDITKSQDTNNENTKDSTIARGTKKRNKKRKKRNKKRKKRNKKRKRRNKKRKERNKKRKKMKNTKPGNAGQMRKEVQMKF
jgi:type IV secretory pathway VirB6-like protein